MLDKLLVLFHFSFFFTLAVFLLVFQNFRIKERLKRDGVREDGEVGDKESRDIEKEKEKVSKKRNETKSVFFPFLFLISFCRADVP